MAIIRKPAKKTQNPLTTGGGGARGGSMGTGGAGRISARPGNGPVKSTTKVTPNTLKKVIRVLEGKPPATAGKVRTEKIVEKAKNPAFVKALQNGQTRNKPVTNNKQLSKRVNQVQKLKSK